MALPPLLTVPDIQERLQTIFPEGTENRNYVTREMAARTVFVMLYVGAAAADRVPAVPAYRPQRNLPAEVPPLTLFMRQALVQSTRTFQQPGRTFQRSPPSCLSMVLVMKVAARLASG